MVCAMEVSTLKKVIKSLQIYARYFNQALLQVYIYYTALSIFQIFLKKLSLANRAIRLLWAPPSPGRRQGLRI